MREAYGTGYALLLKRSKNAESLRLLSLNDNRFVRYFKGHLDRYATLTLNKLWICGQYFLCANANGGY